MFKEGDVFQKSFRTTNETHQQFCELSKDLNPLHTDESFAKEKGFLGKVMHGNILNAYLSYFIGECLPTKDVIIHSQSIQFKNPSYLGDNLSFTATIAGVYESVNAVEFKFNFKNVDNKIIAKGKIQIGLLK